MAKDSRKPRKQKGEEFAELYEDDVDFDEEDFVEDDDILEDDVVLDEEEEAPRRKRRGKDRGAAAATMENSSATGGLKEKFKPRPVRPGEQDVLQSPVVIGLFGGTLFLILVGGILWFIIGRQNASTAFEVAEQNLEAGKYLQAIQAFENFEMKFPTHKKLPEARIGAGKARILQHFRTGAPDWAKSLEELENFHRDFRDSPEYQSEENTELANSIEQEIRGYSKEITIGAVRDAARQTDESLLDVTDQGLKVYNRLGPSEPTPDDLELQSEVKRLRVIAVDAINKQNAYDSAVAAIEGALEANPPRPLTALHQREQLLARYPDVETNRKIRVLLTQTLDAEKNAVQPVTIENAPSRQAENVPAPVMFVNHSRTRSDENSEDRRVYGIAKGCCVAVDSATGVPVWRQSIGLDPLFFPKPVPTDPPGLLLFDTNQNELVVVAERTGQLIWRLPFDMPVVGEPLIEQNEIFLVGLENQLFKIDVETGAPLGVLRFSQPLLAPPLLAPDDGHLVIVGDRELIYTLSMEDFDCVAVSHTGHKRGTGKPLVASSKTPAESTPVIDMGGLILLAENDQTDSCLLRVFRMDEPEKEITQEATHRLQGQVHDAPALRGNQLYVPSTGERISLFSVSDNPDEEPLEFLSSEQLQTPHEGAMHLFAQDGRVWMATSAVRQMDNNTGTLSLVGEPIARGTSAQPIQSAAESLFFARNRPYSTSTLLTQLNLDSMRSNWGLTFGSTLLAVSANDQNLICINEDGQVFRMSQDDIPSSGGATQFQKSPNYELALPSNLETPLGAIALEDGSLFAYIGGDDPRGWFITPNAQLERGVKIPGELECPPIELRGGLVLPVKNRLHFVARSRSGPRVDDLIRELNVNPGEKTATPVWLHLVKLDNDQLIAVDSEKNLMRIQFRESPKPHLFLARSEQLPALVTESFVTLQGAIFLADTNRTLRVLDAQTFQEADQSSLPGVPTNGVSFVNGMLLVETDGRDLHAFKFAPKLNRKWTLPLGTSSLASQPEAAGSTILVAQRNGTVLLVDPQTGQPARSFSLGQMIQGASFPFGSHRLLPTFDGSVFPIEGFLNSGN